MKLLTFILVYPLIWILSILPMPVLYFFSDMLFVLVYYVIGYRKDVVYNNLKIAYPEKSERELKSLTKANFHHFCDFIYETIKTFSISHSELDKRFIVENVSLVNDLEKQGKSIIFLGAHYGNWEWMSHFVAKKTKLTPISVYTPLKNKYFNSALKRSRSKIGTNLVSNSKTIKKIQELESKNIKAAYGLLSDQCPGMGRAHYWTNFFGQFLPVINGAEFIARRNDFAVVNILTTKIKRGYYSAKFELLATNPNEYPENDITNRYFNSITEHIRKAPEYYLWTHKRFKHIGRYEEWLELQKNKVKK